MQGENRRAILLHPASVLFLLMGLLYLLDLADIKFILPAESGVEDKVEVACNGKLEPI